MNWLQKIVEASFLPRTLPVRKVIKVLQQLGYVEKPRGGPSGHINFTKEDNPLLISVPTFNKEIRVGLLKQLIRKMGLTNEQFVALL